MGLPTGKIIANKYRLFTKRIDKYVRPLPTGRHVWRTDYIGRRVMVLGIHGQYGAGQGAWNQPTAYHVEGTELEDVYEMMAKIPCTHLWGAQYGNFDVLAFAEIADLDAFFFHVDYLHVQDLYNGSNWALTSGLVSYAFLLEKL